MSIPAFDDLTDVYETVIDWPKRLANEEPFFRHWFKKIGAQSVVDVACGVGRHAAMFRGWGLRVEGADISPAMLARARANFGGDERLRWVVRGFDQPMEIGNSDLSGSKEPFDAAICTGNSLALAADEETAAQALREMFAAVRPGGIVIVQVLNLWHLPDGPCVWQKCKKVNLIKRSFSPEPTATALAGNFATDEKSAIMEKNETTPAIAAGSELNEQRGSEIHENLQNDLLILKGVHRTGSRGYVDFVVTSQADGKLLHQESIPMLGFESSHLEDLLRQAGGRTINIFGDYRQQAYEWEKSRDLIVVGEK